MDGINYFIYFLITVLPMFFTHILVSHLMSVVTTCLVFNVTYSILSNI